MFKALLKTNASPALVFIRLALGIVIFAHGAQKVLGWFGGAGYAETLDIFTKKLMFPDWMVVLLMVIEFLGSLGLIIGLLTRLSALGIGISMIVCANLFHVQNGFFMNWYGQQKGEGIEYHILVLGMCLALLIHGGGSWATDSILLKARRRGFQPLR
jgi:putative oxidoreductase